MRLKRLCILHVHACIFVHLHGIFLHVARYKSFSKVHLLTDRVRSFIVA